MLLTRLLPHKAIYGEKLAATCMIAALEEPKMASQLPTECPKVGSILAVEVEQALPDLLMVSLKSGNKVFRGVLLDTHSGVCPLGMPDAASLGSRLNKEFGVSVMDTVILPKEDPGMGDPATKVENSALSFRQSYFQNMPLPPARPLLFGKKDKTPEIKPKTISHGRSRQFRLRPRQLLCSNCKGPCSGPKAKTAHNNKLSNKSGLKKRKADSSSEVVVRKKPKPESRTVTNGGPAQVRPNPRVVLPCPISTPKTESKSSKKTSPAIKISYATPGKGQRLVVRIPPRSNNFKGGSVSSTTVSKTKKRILTVPLSPLSTVSKHNIEPQKRPRVNGLHTNSTEHRRIRIVKSKGTYSIPSDNLPVRTYGPVPGTQPKLVNGNGKMTANVMVKPISLVNGYRSLGQTPKKESLSVLNVLPRLDNSDAASDCSSVTTTSRSSGKGGRKKRNGSLNNNNNSECDFDSDTSLVDIDRRKAPKEDGGVHKKHVTKSILPGGRTVCIGDIVWGKIIGFPWWPGRIVQIIVTRNPDGSISSQEAQITWFASRSISYMPLNKLPPFLAEFKQRYDKKRKGLYKEAVALATKAAEALSSEMAVEQGKPQ